MSYKITKKHFKVFKGAVHDWLEIYGLKDWLVSIILGVPEEHKSEAGEYKAICVSDLVSMQAEISINGKWLDEPTDQKIKESAFHEASELLLSPLNILANTRYVLEREIEAARHEIIHRLYNTVAQDKYRK